RDVRARLGTPLGMHPHNDSGLAVANALAAVRAGCGHVQGTINGYGERCGNLDLIPLVATLQLKLGYDVLPPDQLRCLTEVAHFVAAVANLNPDAHAPYVGASAFAHKGGIHVAAVAKLPESYQHIDPALVGNEMRVVVSELSGRQNVRLRAGDLGLGGGARDSDAEILRRVKQLEFQGHQFEAADGSFEMLVRRSAPDYRPPFELLGFTVIVQGRSGGTTTAQAMVVVRVSRDAARVSLVMTLRSRGCTLERDVLAGCRRGADTMGMVAPVFYTVDMVRKLPEDGHRYEVVHGELLVTPAPRPWHEVIV